MIYDKKACLCQAHRHDWCQLVSEMILSALLFCSFTIPTADKATVSGKELLVVGRRNIEYYAA